MLGLLYGLTGLALWAAGPPYRLAVPGYHYQFPHDHFAHPGFRTEWWYYTGNLRASNGHHYGFELVFFRQGERRETSRSPSVWHVDDLYLAHLALTDIDGQQFRYYKRLNRAGPGVAGISFEQGRIWNANWQAQWDKSYRTQTLSAIAEGIRFTLRLESSTPPVIHGENGVSQKGAGVGHASYYVSFPLLTVEGTLNGVNVSGTAWMDHEWFTSELAPNEAGWDWFSVQLDNQTEFMLFQFRHSDGSIDPYSSGTYIDRNGRATRLTRSEFQLQPLQFWTSPKTRAHYPIRWRISVPSMKLTLECAAVLADQELVSEDAAAPTYWEGAVTYSGSAAGKGYLEMTGYAEPVHF